MTSDGNGSSAASELRAIHDHAPAAGLAFANHFAFLLNGRCPADRADDCRQVVHRSGSGAIAGGGMRFGTRRRAQNLREGESRCDHHANDMKATLASNSKVAWNRAHQPRPGAVQNFTAAITRTITPRAASQPATWAMLSHGLSPSPMNAMFLSARLNGKATSAMKTISRRQTTREKK